MITAVRTCVRKYADLSGRAPRSELWWLYLALCLVGLVVLVPTMVLLVVAAIISDSAGEAAYRTVSVLFSLLALGLAPLLLGVVVRRLHDTDRSGWTVLIAFVPLVGLVVLLALVLKEGTAGPNRFGPSPVDPSRGGSTGRQRG